MSTCASIILLFSALSAGDFKENFKARTQGVGINEHIYIIDVPRTQIDHARSLINELPDFVAISRIYEHFQGRRDDYGTLHVRKFFR